MCFRSRFCNLWAVLPSRALSWCYGAYLPGEAEKRHGWVFTVYLITFLFQPRGSHYVSGKDLRRVFQTRSLWSVGRDIFNRLSSNFWYLSRSIETDIYFQMLLPNCCISDRQDLWMMPLSCSRTKIATLIRARPKDTLNRCLLWALNKAEINWNVSSRRSTVPAGVNHVYGGFRSSGMSTFHRYKVR